MRDGEPTEQLRRRVQLWAERLKVFPRVIRVQRMTRKWGSCSTAGTITLAADLHEQEPSFQDFVIAHELLHLRLSTHGRLFRALMTLHLPGWRVFDAARGRYSGCTAPIVAAIGREAGRAVPETAREARRATPRTARAR